MEKNERKGACNSCRSYEIVRRATRAHQEGNENFAKNGEQNFSTEIIRIAKVIERRPRPFFELKDLNRTPIDGQFCQEGM